MMREGLDVVGPRFDDRLVDRLEVVVSVLHPEHLPPVSLVAPLHVFGREGQRRGTVEGDLVRIVKIDELTQTQVSGERGRFRRDSLHEVSVRDQRIRAVIDDGETALVEPSRERPLGDRHSNGVRRTLAERAGGRLDSRGQSKFGMTWRAASPLAEGFQVVHRQVVAREVKERVEKHRAMPGREHEAVAIGEARVPGIVPQVVLPENVGHGGRPERKPGVAGVRLLHRVNRQSAQGVDAELVER